MQLYQRRSVSAGYGSRECALGCAADQAMVFKKGCPDLVRGGTLTLAAVSAGRTSSATLAFGPTLRRSKVSVWVGVGWGMGEHALLPAWAQTDTPITCCTVQGAVRVQANVSTAAESFQIPACPDLIPEGPWKKMEGGVCAAKGFKATGGDSTPTLKSPSRGAPSPYLSMAHSWACISASYSTPGNT